MWLSVQSLHPGLSQHVLRRFSRELCDLRAHVGLKLSEKDAELDRNPVLPPGLEAEEDKGKDARSSVME